MTSTDQLSPLKRPNVLAGSGGRQFSFGGRTQAPVREVTNTTFPIQNSNLAPSQIVSDVAPMHDMEETNKSPFTYALHVVFTSFVRIAEKKINTILGPASGPEPDIMRILGPGTDPAFDKVLKSLGYIARQNPKPVIDSVMFWRKSRSELKSDSNPSFNPSPGIGVLDAQPGLTRRITDASRPSFVRSPSSHYHVQQTSDPMREAAVQTDRKSLVSIFILCRTLIEIVRQINADTLGNDVGDKLEEIVFNQLKNADPESLYYSSLRIANWTLFAELLGWLSGIRFASVSDRFIADLEKSGRGLISKEKEPRVEMIINGMRHLQIKIYPAACLEESAEFLSSLATFFLDAHGHKVKQAYLDVLHHLIVPVAEATEVNYPAWSKLVVTLLPRSMKLLEKSRYWNSAFALTATLLCVSARENFVERWCPLIEQNIAKLKERPHRQILVENATRLVWVAVFRWNEQLTILTRKLDQLFRLFFPVGRRSQHLSDLPQEPLIHLVRYVGLRHQDYCFRAMIFPLIGAEHLNNTNSMLDLEILHPVRITIAIRSFLWILYDLQSPSERPPFPSSFGTNMTDMPHFSNTFTTRDTKSPLLADFHEKFATYLCRVAFFCDQHFGASGSVDERSGTAARPALVSQDSVLNANGVLRERQQYFDLLAAIFDAWPRCISGATPVPKMIEMMCKATAHSDAGIRISAERALKAIATTNKVQSVVVGYARVLLGFDARFPQSTESKLGLYTELLRIWISQIRKRGEVSDCNSTVPVRGEELEMTNIWTIIEETEAHGLYFLCSQSRAIRSHAIEILQLVSEFDIVMDLQAEATKTMGHARNTSKVSMKGSRIIDILVEDGATMLEHILEQASLAERSRTVKLRQERSNNILLRVAESESGVDAAIWFKIFPRLIQLCFRRFPITVVLCRNIICNRLLKMHPGISNAVENLKSPSPFDVMARANTKVITSPESMIEQWKLYLIMACTTLTLADEQSQPSSLPNGKKRTTPQVTLERITSARSLFQLVLPMLAVDHTSVREAIVTSLGCININLYKVLLEDLSPVMRALVDHNKQKTKSGQARSNKRFDRLRTEITHVLQLTSHFLANKEVIGNEWILETVLNFLRDVKGFLSDDDVQVEWEYQKLRRHFCGLLEAVWESLLGSPNPARWLPFEGRVSCFRLIEEWCNHGPYEQMAKQREEIMRQSILDTYGDNRDRGALTASMEIEKRNVEFAALSAMASLCKGPVTQGLDAQRSKTSTMSFEIDGVFAWIAAVFGSSSEKIHSVGRRALTNLLKYNLDFSVLYQEAVHQCYTHDFDSKSAQSYFTVLAEVLTEQDTNPCGLSQLLALCLFKAGDKNVEIRIRTLALLAATETRFYGTTCVEAFRAAISNKNPVIYKRGQYLLAAQVAKDHEEQKFLIFSECSKFFRLVETRLQRDVVAILLPWVQITELRLDINGDDLDAASNMVLVNLFEMTLRFSETLLIEIEGLWTALVSGPFAGNVKAILDFTISQSVARREPVFVTCGKQVIVYLSRSTAGTKLVEALLAYIHPRAMVPQLKEPLRVSADESQFAYVADLDRIFQGQQKHVVFSLGQLALIFLVDLIVVPSPEIVPQAPVLLLVVFLMLDHYIPLVQDQARELFLYLTHNLCVESLQNQTRKLELQQYLGDFRRKDPRFTWPYDDVHQHSSVYRKRTPETLQNTVKEVVDIYSAQFPAIREELGKVALTWATSCPVRHMACRAFQVFRCVSSSIDQNMLSDMLARLSNTIADSSSDIQAFSLEILYTLHAIVDNLQPEDLIEYPQLFWCTAACLETIHEEEYKESLLMLEKLLDKIDLCKAENIQFLLSTMPPKWEGKFEGLSIPLLKGLRSQECMQISLRLVNRIAAMPSNEIVGGDSRLVFAILANLPSFVHALEDPNAIASDILAAADILSTASVRQDLGSVSRILASYSKSKFRNVEDFTRQIASVLRQTYFPAWEASSLIFLLGLLSNKDAWMKLSTMELLKSILPFVDTRRPEFAGVGADLISPLLRLLQTEYAQAGLEVLDKAISISGGPKDRQVLRMSLGNRTIRKEYEKTATLFGIPEDSGWAVPMPASTSAATRTNVHAVFYTCAVTLQSHDVPDHIQFHMDDYAYHAPSERSDTMLSVDGAESSLGDMVSALHNLDVFFTEDAEPLTPITSDLTTEQAPAAVYDSRVAAILSRSLAKTPSMASFTSPGFDTSPKQERNFALQMDRHPESPLGFSFPRPTKASALSPALPKSPAFSQGSESEVESPPNNNTQSQIILDDDKSEASFKLDGQLKKSASSVRAKLWHAKDSDRQKEKEFRKKEKALKINSKPTKSLDSQGLTSPVPGRAYFWSGAVKDRG
ncbi:putative Cell morphogenesis protein [Taphrina deformans PYCC 5710]|uniref:Cell morphogenesis protein n=1 Tax=Taphrina deformans (strain PYCC 5710 / ATCC 11124 / CBS 356.35 / IMI 108563 / JCM 9778 / NBRC 8474) TaxID=1097556 RepID=R4X7S8_TAPDE|nr:putative Cell morphogenesis protein [Taphrina deformans PYCC 5710]|eukprot:CCG81243.1 putative Cell morphogenesis protein [Taphrina deformans PYCC 5710]